jgi:hypothetical protein
VDATRIAGLAAVGRLAAGVAAVAAPSAVQEWMPGRRCVPGDPSWLVRGLGARDVVLALGLLRALRQGRGAAEWGWLVVVSDLVDAAGGPERPAKMWAVAAADAGVALALGKPAEPLVGTVIAP